MEITFMDMARESLRPIVRALGSARPDAQDSEFAARDGRTEPRDNDGIGTPIDDFGTAIGRHLDFKI